MRNEGQEGHEDLLTSEQISPASHSKEDPVHCHIDISIQQDKEVIVQGALRHENHI